MYVGVIAVGDQGEWLDYAGPRFGTHDEAEAYARNLEVRWRIVKVMSIKEKYADMHFTEMMLRDDVEEV